MAMLTRYFSTAAAGAGDGTSWANRAQLVSGATWSTVITGNNFTTDGMLAYIGPGTHASTGQLSSGAFANAPTAANPLILHGCDSSGNPLTPPDENWQSNEAPWDTSSLPIITATSNNTINLANCSVRLLAFSTTGGGWTLTSCALADWVSCTHSGNGTSDLLVNSSALKVSNSILKMTAASFDSAVLLSGNSITNCRIYATSSGGSGNRQGIKFNSGGPCAITLCTINGFAGNGIGENSASASSFFILDRCTIANNTGHGVKLAATASATAHYSITHCCITGNLYGVDAQSAMRVFATGNRLRDNTSGNLSGFGNYPTTFDNYTTDSDDATEYVDASGGDFRIKNTATIWGKGYGVSDEAAAASSGTAGVVGS